jgi:hypothetical protein
LAQRGDPGAEKAAQQALQIFNALKMRVIDTD